MSINLCTYDNYEIVDERSLCVMYKASLHKMKWNLVVLLNFFMEGI